MVNTNMYKVDIEDSAYVKFRNYLCNRLIISIELIGI
jgi:hypothetical protein